MEELFPEDARLDTFASRYSSDKFYAIATRIIVSPAVQLRPKGMPNMAMPSSFEDGQPQSSLPPLLSQHQLPLLPHNQPGRGTRETTPVAYSRPDESPRMDSPKRPYPEDDSGNDSYSRPRKMARSDSPLKGAAGRRLDQQRRNQAAPLELDISFLLGILPPAHQYDFVRFNAGKMVDLLQKVSLGGSGDRGALVIQPGHGRHQSGSGGGDYGYTAQRDSPVPHVVGARNPYDNSNPMISRVVASQQLGGYRSSPLRQDGFESGFETPPAWLPAPGAYGAPPPPGAGPNVYGRTW